MECFGDRGEFNQDKSVNHRVSNFIELVHTNPAELHYDGVQVLAQSGIFLFDDSKSIPNLAEISTHVTSL